MTTDNGLIKNEEVIFYIDLITDFLKKKVLVKGIKSYMQEKRKFNIPSSFGVLLFQGEKNPSNIYLCTFF